MLEEGKNAKKAFIGMGRNGEGKSGWGKIQGKKNTGGNVEKH